MVVHEVQTSLILQCFCEVLVGILEGVSVAGTLSPGREGKRLAAFSRARPLFACGGLRLSSLSPLERDRVVVNSTRTRHVRTTAYTHGESDHLEYGIKNAAGTNLRFNHKVRSAAAEGLGLLGGGSAEVIEELESILKAGKKPELLQDAALALGLLGRRAAAGDLARALRSTRSTAVQSRNALFEAGPKSPSIAPL